MEFDQVKNSYFIKLQQFIFYKLSTNVCLKKKLKVYRKIPKGCQFPLLSLGKLLVFDRSVKDLVRIHFLHEIRIFSKDETIEEMLSWGEVIKKVLSGTNIVWKRLRITEISFLQMELDVMSDGYTNKMVMKFRFNIEGMDVSAERIANVA